MQKQGLSRMRGRLGLMLFALLVAAVIAGQARSAVPATGASMAEPVARVDGLVLVHVARNAIELGVRVIEAL